MTVMISVSSGTVMFPNGTGTAVISGLSGTVTFHNETGTEQGQ